ncbi:helix-turn-helix domain-containing protein [Salmonella enterica subsp. arizonae]|nr:helix-turn-helix domain-containing protein [Salmonella enterica subsp. arizonae]
MNIKDRMTRKEAADYIGVSPATMAVWACTGLVKIPYYRAGAKKVIYMKSDLDAYIESTRTLQAPPRNWKKKANQ